MITHALVWKEEVSGVAYMTVNGVVINLFGCWGIVQHENHTR